MSNMLPIPPVPVNEPVLGYAPGSPERAELKAPADLAGAAVKPGGTEFVAACADGTVRMWQIGQQVRAAAIGAHQGGVAPGQQAGGGGKVGQEGFEGRDDVVQVLVNVGVVEFHRGHAEHLLFADELGDATLRDAALVVAIRRLSEVILQRDIWM